MQSQVVKTPMKALASKKLIEKNKTYFAERDPAKQQSSSRKLMQLLP